MPCIPSCDQLRMQPFAFSKSGIRLPLMPAVFVTHACACTLPSEMHDEDESHDQIRVSEAHVSLTQAFGAPL